MTLPATAHELQQAMAPLNKEERRLYANTIATAFTQRHPLGTTDPKDMMLLRHAFVCLPTPDIEKCFFEFVFKRANEGQFYVDIDCSGNSLKQLQNKGILGYEKSSAIAKEALKTNKRVYDILLEEKLFTKEELDELLQPKNMVHNYDKI